MNPPQLHQCLAHAVLTEPDRWLGLSSPTGLSVFLAGAELRAATMKPDLPSWRIHGPLNEPAFYESLVARTGHPTLTIKWATALELIHFSLADALGELRELVENKFQRAEVEVAPLGKFPLAAPDVFWRLVARRPGMYLGGTTGWHLGWYLAGLTDGGDWLELPEFPGAREIVSAIGQQSKDSYGSEFGGYRVYDHSDGAKHLLGWAGIEPIGDDNG